MEKDIIKYFEGIENTDFIEYISFSTTPHILPSRVKLLCLIAAAQATADYAIIRGLVNWALDLAIPTDEIYEVLLQGHLFCGYPKALESFFVFKDVCRDRGIPGIVGDNDDVNDRDRHRKRGLVTARRIYSKNFDLVYGNIKKLSPELARGMIDEGYGRIISRPGLDLVTRELAIVSILTVSDMPRQLYSHVRGAFNVGASPDLIRAVIEQCRALCPASKIAKALSTMEKSLGNSAHPE